MRIDPYGDSFLGAIATAFGGALVAMGKAAVLTGAILIAGKVVSDVIEATTEVVNAITDDTKNKMNNQINSVSPKYWSEFKGENGSLGI